MKYQIVMGASVEYLTHYVQEYLNKGWRLVGGIATDPPHGETKAVTTFYQAMVFQSTISKKSILAIQKKLNK